MLLVKKKCYYRNKLSAFSMEMIPNKAWRNSAWLEFSIHLENSYFLDYSFMTLKLPPIHCISAMTPIFINKSGYTQLNQDVLTHNSVMDIMSNVYDLTHAEFIWKCSHYYYTKTSWYIVELKKVAWYLINWRKYHLLESQVETQWL